MQRKWKETTYEVATAYAEGLLEKLKADEAFIAICDRAEKLGLEVDCTYQHTYVAEGELVRSPVETFEGRVPRGYALALWVDFITGGRVACCAKEDNPIQLSLSVTAAKYMDLLFSKRVIFLDYEDLIHNEPLFEMLEEYLDLAEEHGTSLSLFMRDGLAPTLPQGDKGILHRGDIVDGSFVEFSKGEFQEMRGEDSLYIPEEAAMPYLLMVHTASGKMLGDHPLTLTMEETEALAEMLENLPHEAKRCDSFAELLVDGIGLSSMTPTPRTAQYLEGLTYLRYKAFMGDLEELSTFVRALVEEGQPLTIIP